MSTRPDGPKEGIYLEATLGVIENKVLTEVDRASSARRHRRWAGVVALALVAVGATSAASAIGISQSRAIFSAAETGEAWQLMCIEGAESGTAPYYGVRFRVHVLGAVQAIDAAQVCASAWESAADTSEQADSIDEEDPEYLSELVGGVFSRDLSRQGIDPTDYVVETGYTARVDHTLYDGKVPEMAICRNSRVPRSLYVITAEPREAHVTDWNDRCAISETPGWSLVASNKDAE